MMTQFTDNDKHNNFQNLKINRKKDAKREEKKRNQQILAKNSY